MSSFDFDLSRIGDIPMHRIETTDNDEVERPPSVEFDPRYIAVAEAELTVAAATRRCPLGESHCTGPWCSWWDLRYAHCTKY